MRKNDPIEIMMLMISVKGNEILIIDFLNFIFSFRRWNKASSELNSHVVTTTARKTSALRLAAPSSNPAPSVFGRISNALFGASSAETEGSAGSSAIERKPKSEGSKRSYGFATKNLALHTDKSSEDLYRFKNLSSDYMRSTEPGPKEEDEAAAASGTGAFTLEKKDSDDEGSDKEPTAAAASSRRQRRSKK
jgi:hypothetical protein